MHRACASSVFCFPAPHTSRTLQGQWKQISRYYVPSRTPTQVASHAQKHFLRQSGANKRRSRFSAVEEAAAAPPPLPPLPLPGLHHAAAPAPGVPGGMPAPLFSPHGVLPPVQHALHLATPGAAAPVSQQPLGSVVGGVALGVPIGVLPPLPSITTASEEGRGSGAGWGRAV